MTVGTMAAASRITSGPVFGSVSEPLKTLPTRPWPAIHIKKEKSAPAARNQPGRRATSGPSPMATETAARIQAVWVPVVENRLADAGEEVGVPAGHAVGHAGDGALDRRAGPVGRQQEQDGGQ